MPKHQVLESSPTWFYCTGKVEYQCSRATLFNIIATQPHVLCKFTLLKIKYNFKISASVIVATFQVFHQPHVQIENRYRSIVRKIISKHFKSILNNLFSESFNFRELIYTILINYFLGKSAKIGIQRLGNEQAVQKHLYFG